MQPIPVLLCRCLSSSTQRLRLGKAVEQGLRHALVICEGVGDVVGVEAPLGGVAQVIFHGVQVVEVGVQVRVHQDRKVEEDGEGQVEVGREVGEDQGERHMCNMRMT